MAHTGAHKAVFPHIPEKTLKNAGMDKIKAQLAKKLAQAAEGDKERAEISDLIAEIKAKYEAKKKQADEKTP